MLLCNVCKKDVQENSYIDSKVVYGLLPVKVAETGRILSRPADMDKFVHDVCFEMLIKSGDIVQDILSLTSDKITGRSVKKYKTV